MKNNPVAYGKLLLVAILLLGGAIGNLAGMSDVGWEIGLGAAFLVTWAISTYGDTKDHPFRNNWVIPCLGALFILDAFSPFYTFQWYTYQLVQYKEVLITLLLFFAAVYFFYSATKSKNT